MLPALFNRREQAIVDRLDEALPVLVEAIGPSAPIVLEAARLTEARRSTGAEHLDRLREALDAGADGPIGADLSDLPIITVPELFARSSGPASSPSSPTRSTDELDPDDAHRTGRRASMSELDPLLASREMILVAGSGGVGKTTIAAALGVAAAQRQQRQGPRADRRPGAPAGDGARARVVRQHAGARAREHSPCGSGVELRGELWAAMLDTKAGWDELIRRHAPDAATRDAVLANPLYENITSRFVHSHEYLAMEQLHDLHATGRFDLVIVDTPPSRNALSILDAPSRMVDFFGSRLLRWLTVPYRSRLFTAASKPFYQVADRVLGSRFLQDIADFFVLFQAMEPGFVRRAREVEELLVDPRTAFVVVTTLETAPSYEARFLARELRRRGMSLGAIVANRVLPSGARRPGRRPAAAQALVDQADGPLARDVARA